MVNSETCFLQVKKIPEPIPAARASNEPMMPVLVHTTLIRDQNGLGFSIAGGKSSPPFKDNTDVSYRQPIVEFYIYDAESHVAIDINCQCYRPYTFHESRMVASRRKMENCWSAIKLYR